MTQEEKIKTEFKKLYNDIDECITSLLRARKLHDGTAVAEAYRRMETLMVATQQNISWMLGNLQDETVGEDLEEAANNCYYHNQAYARESFIEGSEWKEKQMMKQAVGGWVSNTLNHDIRITSEWFNEKKHPFKFGDKVKLVIIKDE